jgi:hypothetical protein
MGKIFETKINRFDGGVSDSPREPSANKFSISKHFDIFTDSYKLSPYRSFTADNNDQYGVGNFLFSSTGYLMGLGNKSGQTYPQIYVKNGADKITDFWNTTTPTNFTGSRGAVNYNCFVEFRKSSSVSYLYFTTFDYLCRVKVDDTEVMAETFKDLLMTAGATGQGVVHPSTNTLYIPNNLKVVSVTVADVKSNDAAPSIGSDLEIVALVPYGDNLAIACRGVQGKAHSQVFIWDMVSTTSWVDVLDWGEEELMVLNNLDNVLWGVSQPPNYLDVFALEAQKTKFTVRYYDGGKKAKIFKEVHCNKNATETTLTINRRTNFVYKGRLYFTTYFPDATYPLTGIWCIGKNNEGNYVLTMDRIYNATETVPILSVIYLGDAVWIAHTAEGTIWRSNSPVSYNYPSVYESQIFNAGDSSITKKLIGASVQTEKLTASGQVTLKYRVDGATSWTEIFTNADDTNYPISFEAINISGDTLPQFREIEFRIESLYGTEITGFSFKYEVIDNRKY